MRQVQGVHRRSVLMFCSASLLLAARPSRGGEAPEVEWTVVLPSHFAGKEQDLGKTSDGGLILSADALLKFDAHGAPLWETSFEGTVGLSVRELKDGHYILGGGTFMTGQGMALIKVDPQGRILWQRAFGGEGAFGHAVEATDDGGYAVTGIQFSPYVVRTDGDGNVLWEATYLGANPSEGGSGNSLQETPDGGFIVAGQRPLEGAVLLKVDWQGNLLWEKRLSDGGGHGGGSGVSAVRVTEDGGYLLAGWESRADAGRVGFLWKTDKEGNLLWKNRFPGSGGWLSTLDLTLDGGAVAVGTVQVLPPAGEEGVGELDVYLVRVNQAGELLWEKRLLTADHDVGLGVVQMPDGGYAVSTTTAESEGPLLASLIKFGPDPSSPGPFLRRGDVGGEGTVDLSDAIFTLYYLFAAGPAPPCLDASDADDDGEVNLTDGIVILQFLFLGGHPPSSPGPNACGPDPTPDGLSCRTSGSCAGGGA